MIHDTVLKVDIINEVDSLWQGLLLRILLVRHGCVVCEWLEDGSEGSVSGDDVFPTWDSADHWHSHPAQEPSDRAKDAVKAASPSFSLQRKYFSKNERKMRINRIRTNVSSSGLRRLNYL